MPALTLELDNRDALAALLGDDTWLVACLCAAWCDVCTEFRGGFDALADRHPDKMVLWVDIEDHADLVGDFDVDDFPMLLIQRGDAVTFYGAIEPDAAGAHRLVLARTQDNATGSFTTTPACAHDLRHALQTARRS